MVNIPVRFKWVGAAFDEAGRARSCESSGSEHSADLCDLVNSFLEREIGEQSKSEEGLIDLNGDGNEIMDDESERKSPDFDEFEEYLKNLFDRENDSVEKSIHAEVETALREVGGDRELKRRLMARLRDRGFDAGLCKSKWEKSGRGTASGDYEYIDVNAGETRYIIEVNLAGEFTIARPTTSYASLLEVFPHIFVGKPEELKKVVRKMNSAIRTSMKSGGIHVPPWRRLAYMQAKWFGSYKRTTNEVPNRNRKMFQGGPAENKSVGFVPVLVPGISVNCRDDFAARAGGRVGNLTAAFNQKEMIL